ncbi:MAG: hypothetical protein H9928_09345 [Candidatus Phocaeicola excrementipullorum]|uniref:Uncharacterized protein n=1 Tax=Candidatus Phocaeicola excrementipullorum TaxID=2838731 RepID=A0A948TNM2_9BACT|nr:hypothetical protein [Candidatus Phocaeicola excrementipullorum]MBW9200724.1 hypothetical protein [Bacteroidales bacterium SW299]
MNTIYELIHIEVENQRYPLRKIKENSIGLFTTLEKAQKGMMRHIADEMKENEHTRKLFEEDGEKWKIYSYTFGYEIAEREVNELYGQWCSRSVRTYKSNGELNDECLIADTAKKTDPFLGRPKEKIRFKVGDIVEVFEGGEAELHVITALPWTTEKVERLNKKLLEKGECSLLDASDDCYLAYSLGIGDTHGHPACTDVFRPTKKVSSALKHKLWAKLIEAGMVYGHDIPHSFLMEHANDEKLNEEILTGIEKMANKDTIDFWPYDMKTHVTEMTKILGFSEKQVQRLLKAADKFEQLYKRS